MFNEVFCKFWGGETEPLGEETHPAGLYADKPLLCVCVSVCLSVCLPACLLPQNLLHTSFLCRKQAIIGYFVLFSRFL